MFIQKYFGLIATILCIFSSFIGVIYNTLLKKYPQTSIRIILSLIMLILFIFLTFAWYLKQNGMDIQIIDVKQLK